MATLSLWNFCNLQQLLSKDRKMVSGVEKKYFRIFIQIAWLNTGDSLEILDMNHNCVFQLVNNKE